VLADTTELGTELHILTSALVK